MRSGKYHGLCDPGCATEDLNNLNQCFDVVNLNSLKKHHESIILISAPASHVFVLHATRWKLDTLPNLCRTELSPTRLEVFPLPGVCLLQELLMTQFGLRGRVSHANTWP